MKNARDEDESMKLYRVVMREHSKYTGFLLGFALAILAVEVAIACGVGSSLMR